MNDWAPRRLKIAGGASCKTCPVAGAAVGSCSQGCKRGSPPGASVRPAPPEDAVTAGPAAPGSRLLSGVRGRRRRAHACGGQRLGSCLQPPLPPLALEMSWSIAGLIPEPESGGFFCFFVLMTVASPWACHAQLISCFLSKAARVIFFFLHHPLGDGCL